MLAGHARPTGVAQALVGPISRSSRIQIPGDRHDKDKTEEKDGNEHPFSGVG